MKDLHPFVVTTAKEMEPLLAQELNDLGIGPVETFRGGVKFTGDLKTAYRVCLWSRIANRVLLPIRSFPAPNPEKLYGGMRSIKWSEHLSAKNSLAIDFSATDSQITHTHFGALKAKDAIVDQLRSVQGDRPSIDTQTPDLRVNIYLNKDIAQVSIDLSGESLHKRGYRTEGAFAPLKENLAAAILALAEWKPEQSDRSFLDPMCGSGTLPIEAALIATRTAPGLNRKYFGFLNWKGHDAGTWDDLLTEARDLIIRDKKKIPKIIGYDQDFRAVRIGIANAENAGLRGVIHIEKREFALTARPTEAGIIVLNPPYGERLGEEEALKPLYKNIGDTFKQKFKGWNGFVFTGNPELAKSIGLKASRRYVLFNGAIECRLLKYELY